MICTHDWNHTGDPCRSKIMCLPRLPLNRPCARALQRSPCRNDSTTNVLTHNHEIHHLTHQGGDVSMLILDVL